MFWPSWSIVFHKCTIFIQGGAPCHRSKVATDFPKNNISVLEWPGNSADPNSIENLWTTAKDKAADKQPSSAQHLKQAIKDVMVTDVIPRYYDSQVSSMSRRTQAVIGSKGGHTKYWREKIRTLLDDVKFHIMLCYLCLAN